MPRRSFSLLLIFSIALSLLGGCSHYHLGSPKEKLPFNTLYIAPVQNRTYIPQAQALLSQQLALAFQQAGVLITHNPDQADAHLDITLIHYDRTTATIRKEDAFLAKSFTLRLTAECTLIDQTTGLAFFKHRSSSASLNTFTEKSTQSVEYQDMPVLTQKLAQNIKNLVISVW